MTGTGLEPVANPAAAFRGRSQHRRIGIARSQRLWKGRARMLVEIQALASKAGFGTPQRVATGLDHRRLALLLAVLERLRRPAVGNLDVFCERDGRRAAYRAVHRPCRPRRPWCPPSTTARSGRRTVPRRGRPRRRDPSVAGVERRLAEAARQGFRRVFLSARSRGTSSDLEVIGLEGIGELARRLAA